ncbi:MAG: hypothetical protein ABJO27_19340 [Pseudoruegeria sp.]
MLRFLPALLVAFPLTAYAAGSDSSDSPPPPKCENGEVWDEKTERCAGAKESHLNDDTLYQATREYAYAGQYEPAEITLAAMSDQTDDRVLTYKGFIARKTGQMEIAMDYYHRAITQNPNNLLARSYMGQGLVDAGQHGAALDQLVEIRLRGGKDLWVETALAEALLTGETAAY